MLPIASQPLSLGFAPRRMSDLHFRCTSEEETNKAGREIAALLPPDAVVLLRGDLGAGKTFLVRSIAAALGADPQHVSSPSFALIHEYLREDGTSLIHIDGYRLSDRPVEWMEIGIPDLLRAEGLKFIEWPREGFPLGNKQPISIDVRVNEDESRTIDVEGVS